MARGQGGPLELLLALEKPETPGGARGSLEEPGEGARRSQEEPGGAGGGARRSEGVKV